MNWGTRIFIFLLLFILTTVGVGFYMVSRDTDTLVEQDYYEQGLQYDSVYQHKQNVLKHQATPTIQIKDDYLFITFVQSNNVGTLYMSRPSDQQLDFNVPFSITGKTYTLPIADLKTGLWHMEIRWQHQHLSYQINKTLQLP